METLPTITDAYMMEMLSKTQPYTIVILHKTPKRDEPGADAIIREHGRRNFALRAAGLLAVVCPVRDESDVSGIGIFTSDPDKTKEIMTGDPAVQAGILLFEIHATRTFAGDKLPDPTAS